MTRAQAGTPRPATVLILGLAALTGCGTDVNLSGLSTADPALSSGETGEASDTSTSGPTTSSSSSTTSTGPVTIETSETAVTLPPDGWRAFVATVENATNKNVTWTLDPPDSGTFDVQDSLATVRYFAPATPGTYQLIATSDEDPTASASVTITVSVAAPIEVVLFYNWNTDAVLNNPLEPTTFTVTETRRISFLDAFHYNNGPDPPGTLALRHSDDTLYGPWQVIGLDSNAWWVSYPDVDIKPGTYTVVDSIPETWSMNAASGFRGFARVHALPIP